MELVVFFGLPKLSVAAKVAMVNEDFHDLVQTDRETYKCVIDPCAAAVFGTHKLSQCINTSNKYYTNSHLKIFKIEEIEGWIDVVIAKGKCPSCQNPLKKRTGQFYGCSTYKPPRPKTGCVTKLFSPKFVKTLKRKRKIIQKT